MNRDLFTSAVGLMVLFVLFGFTLTGNANLFKVEESQMNPAWVQVKERRSFEFNKAVKTEDESNMGLSGSIRSNLDTYIENLYHKRGFNGSIVIGRDGYMVYKNHIGYTNLRYRTQPINDTSSFQLASLSKQFTAAAVMLLYQQGKLGYDDRVTRYIANFPYKEVTLRQLLNHTSGVPNYMWLAERKWEKETPPDNREMIKMMCRYNLKPHFKPGTRYKYSNTGYMILVGIVEQISEKPIDAFLYKHFFSKLGMGNTYARSFSDHPIHRYKKDSSYPGELLGYRYSRRRYVAIPPTVNDGAVGDKGIYSTGVDLLKWDQSLERHFILADTTFQAAYKKGVTTRGDTIPYGFGYHIPKGKKDLKAYHNGVWNGFTNTFRKYHKDSLTIILLSNNSFKGITPAINGIKNIIN